MYEIMGDHLQVDEAEGGRMEDDLRLEPRDAGPHGDALDVVHGLRRAILDDQRGRFGVDITGDRGRSPAPSAL